MTTPRRSQHPELGTVIIAITFQMCSYRGTVTIDIVGVDQRLPIVGNVGHLLLRIGKNFSVTV